jgi:hypothetical protein
MANSIKVGWWLGAQIVLVSGIFLNLLTIRDHRLGMTLGVTALLATFAPRDR